MAVHYLNFDAATNGSGAALSPFNNFAAAEAAVTPGDTVFWRGKLRGSVVFTPSKGGSSPAAKTRWVGEAAEPADITGGEIMTGWTICGPGDEVDVGVNYLQMHKKTITKSSIISNDPYSANICENGVQLNLCVSRADTTEKFFITRAPSFWQASSVTASGGPPTGIISQYRLPAVTDLFTELQIERARVYGMAYPNVLGQSEISDFDPVTKFITLATPYRYESNSLKDHFALANLLPAMKRGEWGFIDNGTTVTFYVWPNDVASLTNKIEYSARNVGININGTSNLEVAFFKARQTSGGTNASGNLFNFGPLCSDVYLHNFESSDMANFSGAQAAVYMSGVNNLEMSYFDVYRSQGMFGIFLQGKDANGPAASVNMMTGANVHHFTVSYTSSGPVRCYTLGNSIISHCIFWQTARQAHGNTLNGYQSCYNLLWWGIDGEDSDGFFTMQESDSFVVAFSSASASQALFGGARGFYHQQGAYVTQGTIFGFKEGAVFNCRAVPWGVGGRLTASNSLKWGTRFIPEDRYRILNNIFHGYSAMTAADLATIIEFDHNIITIGPDVRGPNDEIVAATDLYRDAALDDFRYKAGARVYTKPGKNMEAYVNALKSRWPQMKDWDKDMVGDTINWATLGVGPTMNKDAVYGEARNIRYAGIVASGGGGGGEPTRPVFAPGFKLKVAA